MSKVGHYLQEHVTGDVITSADARRYFSTDNSIFTVTPSLILYPKDENDVRKAARFTWQLAERGRVIPITARGAGTDQSGAALGSGIIMAFPAHMNRIIEFDSKSGTVTVEPGTNYGKLQQTLQTHGRFLPPYPASFEYSTVGGAVANNASGEKTVKYGDTSAFVKGLRVVLANGEVINTKRISKRELSKKLGLSTFEGELYRSVDALLEEHSKTVESMARNITKNSAGYDLLDVRRNDGSFDLTPLFVGSQGTLGIITEVTLSTELHNPEVALMSANFTSAEHLQEAVLELKKGHNPPSSIEFVDKQLLEFIDKNNPSQLKGIVTKPFPNYVLIVEYDNAGRLLKKNVKHAKNTLQKLGSAFKLEFDFEAQESIRRIRTLVSTVITHGDGNNKSLPVADDGIVPLENLAKFIGEVQELLKKNELGSPFWGHAGDGHIHMQPHLDISQVGDRQKAYKLMDEYYKLVISLGGSISGEYGDGRLRGAYLQLMYGDDLYALFQKVKVIFDPYGTLNPGVKIGVDSAAVKSLLRSEYSLGRLYNHLPYS